MLIFVIKILYLVTNFGILISEHTLHNLQQGKQEIMCSKMKTN
jgi:hypothetical protein